MTEHAIEKALEVWTLQNLANLTILLGMFVLGMVIIQAYYRDMEKNLSLRVSLELWRVIIKVLPDLFLAFIVVSGYLLMNPDIMADIKLALPFTPLATVLFAVALVLRLFHGGNGKVPGVFRISTWLLVVANLSNMLGYSLVMEAASSEYLELHPSPFWTFVKTHLRSNVSPNGIELAQLCFYIFFPILLIVLFWALYAGMNKLPEHLGKEN
ncbi:MAG: hypothetical protein GXP49_03140 [Deltaproteobacteria bacterium]|nr:hypothetical protein [Deltaproteobacteria bacterium]